MSASKTNRPIPGFSRHTRPHRALSGGSAYTGGNPGGVIFQDNNGNDWYIWVDTAGNLRMVDAVTAEASGFNWNTGAGLAAGIVADEVAFAENGAGTYTGSVTVPAGATILDIIVNGVALWTAATSATMKVGDVAVDDGYFTGVNLKATDLLAGESLSFDEAGGKAGSYIANSQVSPRYSATARVISGIITSVGAGTAGRTRMTVIYCLPTTVTSVTQ